MSGIVVVSPHLDDAVMSVGGLIFRLARSGGLVRVLTVFAGLRTWTGATSAWDSRRGLDCAADAFAARAAEDDAAAAALGVAAYRLPFLDGGYSAVRDPDAIWAAMAPYLLDADAVLVPGSPLAHDDHRAVTELVVARMNGCAPLGFYTEQPYSSRPRYLAGFLRHSTPAVLHQRGLAIEWTDVHLDRVTRRAKADAVACYAGELHALGWRAHLDALVQRVAPIERIGTAVESALPGWLVTVP